MEAKDFCYWLKGYIELGGDHLNAQQIKILSDKLEMVLDETDQEHDQFIGTPVWDGGTTITITDGTGCVLATEGGSGTTNVYNTELTTLTSVIGNA